MIELLPDGTIVAARIFLMPNLELHIEMNSIVVDDGYEL